MGLNVAKEVAAMERMTVPELRARYAEVFGEECRSRHKQLLAKRVAWRLQALAGGDLSERARMRAAELANDADLRLHALTPKKAMPACLTATGTPWRISLGICLHIPDVRTVTMLWPSAPQRPAGSIC